MSRSNRHDDAQARGHGLRPLLVGTTLLLGLFFSVGALAQVQRSFVNLGFEQPDLVTAGCRVYINAAQVPGWNTTHPNNATENSGACVVAGGLGASPGPILELWQTPRDNASGGTVNAPEGNQIAELNANEPSRIFQNVCLVNGEQVGWRFSHRGRSSATVRDVAEMKVGASSTVVRVATTNNGTIDAPIVSQGTLTGSGQVPGNTSWRRYTGTFNYAGATGLTNIGFEAVGGGTSGNLLDDIQITVSPFVEFAAPSTTSPETSPGANKPTIRVSGNVATAFSITVLITGGTATLGTDYTTAGNSTTLTVPIPAGTYDGVTTGLFPIPFTVSNDTVGEGNETIQFEIQPAIGTPPTFFLLSNTVCGGAGQATSTYTIIDNDALISVSKDAAVPVSVAGSLTLFDVVYTIAVNNPSTQNAVYTLVDTPGLDPNVSIVSAGSTRANAGGGSGSGTGTLALTGSGPWSLTTANRTLNPGATDTYTLTVRIQINQGGPPSNDACATPSTSGNGLHNVATATLVGGGNPAFTDNACRNTPTPVWATLSKQLQGRAVASDQMEVRMLSGGILRASATTAGVAAPTSATTGQIVLPAGATLQFEESVKANGTGADQAPTNYAKSLSCTNGTAGSTTVLPSGTGTALATEQQWPDFTPAPGDVLACTITNTPGAADLSITKTNTPAAGPSDQAADTVTRGTATTYDFVVRNNGPAAANNAAVRDPAATGLTACTLGTPACAASGGATCPATGAGAGQLSIANLQGAGVQIPLLPNGGAVTFRLTCTVQ